MIQSPNGYYTKVSPVEVWASYARLRDMGWKQERIAKAKGVGRPTVTWRLKLHDERLCTNNRFCTKNTDSAQKMNRYCFLNEYE